MRRQFSGLQRTAAVRAPKSQIVIFSEGDKTERDYIEAVKRKHPSPLWDVKFHGGVGVPATIANKISEAIRSARSRKNGSSYSKNDEFWAIFDCDHHPRVMESINKCRHAGARVGFSNPCFELWLVLHFEEYDRPCTSNDIQMRLSELCGDYDPNSNKTTNCQPLLQNLLKAENRAKKQLERRKEEGNPPRAPHTTVYELTERIRSLA